MPKLAEAKLLAEQLVEQMKPFCGRIMIAGSIRRGKETVKDVEICAIPKFETREKQAEMFDLFAGLNQQYESVNLLFEWATKNQTTVQWIKTGTSEIIPWQIKPDGKYWRGVLNLNAEQIKLDLFLLNPLNWGIQTVIRTGPAEFSGALVTFLKKKTKFRAQEGHLRNEAGEIIGCGTEEEFFREAGMQFVPVAQRRADKPYDVLKFADHASIERETRRGNFLKKISITENGHYPFQMGVETSKGETKLISLAPLSIREVYEQAMKYLEESPNRLYFTVDFPANDEIKNNFVAVYFKEKDSDWDLLIIPYDEQGNRLETISSGTMHDGILQHCKISLAD